MAVKAPPGRAGRLWLVRRLEVARSGADVLDQKRRTLLRERDRVAERLGAAEEEWGRCARAAVDSNACALATVGERRLRLAAVHGGGRAELAVVWRNVLGTTSPRSVSVHLDDAPDLVALGGPSVAVAAEAHRRALRAAAAYAAVRAAVEAVEAELAATNRRLRAIERRWIPQHEEALARLDLALDESEREDIARVGWALERQDEVAREGPAA